IPQDSIFRIERRLGEPGRIQRLFKKIDALGQLNSENARREAQEEIKADVLRLLRSLESETDQRALLAEIPQPVRPTVPYHVVELIGAHSSARPVRPTASDHGLPIREVAIVPSLPEIESSEQHIRRRRRVRPAGQGENR